MLAPIQLGSTVIYMARFSAMGAVNAIREHGVSLMFAVPQSTLTEVGQTLLALSARTTALPS